MAADYDRLVSALRSGGVVACPTETQMGLLADALDPRAVSRVCDLKGRRAGDPIGLLLPSAAALSTVAAEPSGRALELAREHWPGPLTLVLWARTGLPPQLLRDGKVAVRVPGPSPALELVRAFGGPLTATSANPSGQPPAADAASARQLFGDGLAGAVEGAAASSVASTVVDVTCEPPVVLRRGAIAL